MFSADELFTLVSMIEDHSEPGKQIIDEALHDAEPCELSGLIEKKMAKKSESDIIEVAPIIKMIIEAIAHAESVKRNDIDWEIKSQWVDLKLEAYPFRDEYFRITPINQDRKVGS